MDNSNHKGFIEDLKTGALNEYEINAYIKGQSKESLKCLSDSIHKAISRQVVNGVMNPSCGVKDEGDRVVSRYLLKKQDLKALDQDVERGEAPHLYGAHKLNGEWVLLLPGLELARRLIEEKQNGGKSKWGVLPQELQSDTALFYINKAIEEGWITKRYGLYHWNLFDESAACFVVDMNQILWGKDPDMEKTKQNRISYKPFTTLFGFERDDLLNAYNDVKKQGLTYNKEYGLIRERVFNGT